MPRSRRPPFVQVLVASLPALSLTSESRALANPPAPSSIPDPLQLPAPKPGEAPHRVKRHDGGCFAYHPSGAITKVVCPAMLDRVGGEVERAGSGECVRSEPWEEEPKSAPCPPALGGSVDSPPSGPSGNVAQSKNAMQGSASLEPTRQGASCGRCSAADYPARSSGALASALIGLAVIGATVTRRRRRD